MNDAEKTAKTNEKKDERSLNDETLLACRNAAAAMIRAMEAQNEFRTMCAQTAARLDMGLPVEENAENTYREKNDAAKRAVEVYRDSHILAHRTACAEQLLQYREKDGETLLPSEPFTYNRDPVDAAIAEDAMAKWAELGVGQPGKNYLLVGTCAPANTTAQLFASNTHSPIPLKEAVSKRVKEAFGKPVYSALNPELSEYQNERQPISPAEKTASRTAAPKRDAQQRTADRLQKPRRYERIYHDAPDPHRRRTTIVADKLYEEKAKKGVRLSPDPAKQRSVEKKREKTSEMSAGK